MQTRNPRRVRLASSAVMALTLMMTAAACGGSDDDSDDSSADGPTTITVATFNEFGYEDLIDEWNAAHDDIKIEQVKVGTWDDAKANLYTKLAAGSGLSDIEAIEGDAIAARCSPRATRSSTSPTPSSTVAGWTSSSTRGTNADGQMIGYGTDVGPEGICYRADLFKKAGLPTDREEVAALMGTWDDYFATGEKFVEAMPDTAWYDSSGGLAQAMLNQVENPFETDDETVDDRQPRAQGGVGRGDRQRGGGCPPRSPSGATTGPRVPEQRLRHDGLPGLDARRHRGQLRGRRGLGHRQRLPRWRRQLGWLVPDRPRPGRQRRGGQGGRRLADRARAAGQGVRRQGHLPEPGRGAWTRPRSPRPSNPFFNDAPDRRDLGQPRGGDHGAALQGPEVLRHPARRSRRRSSGSTTVRRTPTSRGTSS